MDSKVSVSLNAVKKLITISSQNKISTKFKILRRMSSVSNPNAMLKIIRSEVKYLQ